jgi:DNA-binding XRE family transcriptional regulator/predicted RNase H-like HicB family nuclease
MLVKGFVHAQVEGEDGFAVEVPALNVVTSGLSVQDAKSMAREAVALQLAGLEDVPVEVRLIDQPGMGFILEVFDTRRFLAAAIRGARAQAAVSQAALADRLGERSKTGVAQYEQGKVEPSFHKMDEILTALGLALEVRLIDRSTGQEVRLIEEEPPSSAAG